MNTRLGSCTTLFVVPLQFVHKSEEIATLLLTGLADTVPHCSSGSAPFLIMSETCGTRRGGRGGGVPGRG